MASPLTAKPLRSQLRTLRARAMRHSTQCYLGLVLSLIGLLVLGWSGWKIPKGKLKPKFVFVFSTGRCGTQHLARSLESPNAYVTHEEEHVRLRTREVVAKRYRQLAAIGDEATFNASVEAYVRGAKTTFWNYKLKTNDVSTFVYTGHLAAVFGLTPAIWNAYPGRVRFVRLRRARIPTAISLMALGPAEEDPWGITPLRWFPTPDAAFTRLKVDKNVWKGFNRFQKWLWFVDDVECRWQALKRVVDDEAMMEVSLEELSILDNGRKWKELANFMGVNVGKNKNQRHNSIQSKKRVKDVFDESTLRDWDVQYRKLVGDCFLDNQTSYRWQ